MITHIIIAVRWMLIKILSAVINHHGECALIVAGGLAVYVKEAALIELREDEKDAVFVQRNGQFYLVIRTDPQNGPLAFMNHTSRIELNE